MWGDATFVFDKVNAVLDSGIERSHVLLDALCVFLLRLWVALKQLNQAAYVVNFVVLLSDVRFYYFNLLLDSDRAKTSLCNPLELHFQESHVGRTLSTIDICTWLRQILETNWVRWVEGCTRVLLILFSCWPEWRSWLFIELKGVSADNNLTLVSWEWASLCL
jgi:hypothetical protein